jgi:hypothetical protein
MSRINFFFAGSRIYASFFPRIYHLYNTESALKMNKCTLFSAMDPLLPLSGLEKGTAGGVGSVPPAVAVKGTIA